MSSENLQALLQRNAEWSARIKRDDPDFFEKLSHQQAPQYLWIGCSDSRVPANQIVGLLPGEVFVHRNVANLVVQSDLNCLSVIQYAVDLLKVGHIIVCGHYGCGGVDAAIHGRKVGLADNWLRLIGENYHRRQSALAKHDEKTRNDIACEMNVVDQVRSVMQTTVVQDAWARGQQLTVHGWIYGIQDGLIRPVVPGVAGNADLDSDKIQAIEKAIIARTAF